MNNVVVKTEWVKSWSENGVGWVQLNHENKLNPLSAGFILAIKEAAEKLNEGYDSVLACTEHQEFTYFKGKPVNFNPEVIQKTQDLEPVIMGNGAFFIFTKKIFKENNNRTGQNPYFYPITFPESVEIDNEPDFKLARGVYGK